MSTKKTVIVELILLVIIFSSVSFKKDLEENSYSRNYFNSLEIFNNQQHDLLKIIQSSDIQSQEERSKIKEHIYFVRNSLKQLDFWLRYLEPISYKKINGPLPVEWETEVFEKFEKPYRREGAGLTLAGLYLEEDLISKDSLFNLIQASVQATRVYREDSITTHLKSFDHFYLCNRLFLLNLATIYTTGFECPDVEKVIPELQLMLKSVYATYLAFNATFPKTELSDTYLNLYKEAITFVNHQSENYEQFDHFIFIRDYINPLFAENQYLIRKYKVSSKSYVDYSLNKNSTSIFSKSLYKGQNAKGIFLRVYDEKTLAEIEALGKLLFYDPILSGNNLRSCASCHKPDEYFTDTSMATSLQFNKTNFLPRNSPSLINTPYNHLLMADGLHYTMQNQTRAVITNSAELSCSEKELLKKVLSCNEYKSAFTALLKYTPQEPKISMEHISSAITLYYSKFSYFNSPFDEAMNKHIEADLSVKKGFNLFMSKAECGTCHFAPQFNGVKPPFVGSEFEVLGVPKDTLYSALDEDRGRYLVNPANETLNAFRTGSVRNAAKTKPYMHNGVFTNLNQVIEFYNGGGGAGRGFDVPNQTLSSDSLHLTQEEKTNLIAFINSLNETIVFETPPQKLAKSKIKTLNTRKVGGEY